MVLQVAETVADWAVAESPDLALGVDD